MDQRLHGWRAGREHGLRAASIAGLALLTMWALSTPSLAQGTDTNAMIKAQLERVPTGEAGVDQIMGPMTARLDLSEKQVEEIRPIVGELVSSFESAKGKFETGEYTVMKMMMEMNAQGERAATLVEPHLSETQLAEYQAMRSEQKARMMDERRKAMQDMMKARQAEAAASAASAESAQ